MDVYVFRQTAAGAGAVSERRLESGQHPRSDGKRSTGREYRHCERQRSNLIRSVDISITNKGQVNTPAVHVFRQTAAGAGAVSEIRMESG
ncbi:hypothetical protein [Cyclobacterium roseum]|uniref:hypothetical protein n=1 Tax=Cyclobacterium roseum TaxID=2666137 RepID=UPI001391431E|nr:hypothetical protein [Cyclobacterium roseum]